MSAQISPRDGVERPQEPARRTAWAALSSKCRERLGLFPWTPTQEALLEIPVSNINPLQRCL